MSAYIEWLIGAFDHVSRMQDLRGSLIPQGIVEFKLNLSVNGFHRTITPSNVLYLPKPSYSILIGYEPGAAMTRSLLLCPPVTSPL